MVMGQDPGGYQVRVTTTRLMTASDLGEVVGRTVEYRPPGE